MIPSYITHYYLPDRRPFLNLSELDDSVLDLVLTELREKHSKGELKRTFPDSYVEERRKTERHIRQHFVRKGGKPTRSYPHYFVLGESTTLRDMEADLREVRIPLSEVYPKLLSFTWPDSMASLELAEDPQLRKPYHGQVFTLQEIAEVVRHHGSPVDGLMRTAQHGYINYIEAQLWSDEPVAKYVGE